MTTFLNLPAHHLPINLSRFAKVISVNDEEICRYKIQLNVNNLQEPQITFLIVLPITLPPLWPGMPK